MKPAGNPNIIRDTNGSAKLRIKPLSDGIGLGQARPKSAINTFRHQQHLQRAVIQPQPLPHLKQALNAYSPHSTATALRGSPAFIIKFSLIRFLAGVGLDLIVALLSIVIVGIAGIFAWNIGDTGSVQFKETLQKISFFLHQSSHQYLIVGCIFVVFALVFFWRITTTVSVK